jgi:hypothetical protein
MTSSWSACLAADHIRAPSGQQAGPFSSTAAAPGQFSRSLLREAYDTKYAMHALPLGLQGVELLTTGRITLAVPQPHNQYLPARPPAVLRSRSPP